MSVEQTWRVAEKASGVEVWVSKRAVAGVEAEVASMRIAVSAREQLLLWVMHIEGVKIVVAAGSLLKVFGGACSGGCLRSGRRE